MTLHCKNFASSLFTLLMKRLRILLDPLRRASGCNVWLMEGIGAIHSSARPEVGVCVTIPIGVGMGARSRRRKLSPENHYPLSWRALHRGLAWQ